MKVAAFLPAKGTSGRIKNKKVEAGNQHSIYQTYQIYPAIRRGDMIAMGTEVPERSYFDGRNVTPPFGVSSFDATRGVDEFLNKH